MAKTTVFANGLGIACKAVDGKSTAAFPDPCWTNPGPSAGPVVVPFANTAYAKDTANASKTVFIGGKPVMLRDKSYFKSSTGNEAAAYGKGFSTGVKQGKAYFASWSMNVKIEGHNVCRHTDLMTHNHGSTPGNTAVWHYTDKSGGKPPKECFNDCVAIEKACGKGVNTCEAKEICGGRPCPGRKEKRKEETKRAKKGHALAMFMKQFGKKFKDFRSWKQEHCRGSLLINSCGFDKAGEMIQNLEGQITKLTEFHKEIPKMLGKFIDELGIDGLKKWAGEAGEALLGKGIERAAMKKVPLLGQLDMIADSWRNLGKLSEFRQTLMKSLPELHDGLMNLSAQVQESIDVLKSDIDLLKRIEKGEIDEKSFLEIQRKQAQRNPCVSARKCHLSNYSASKSLASKRGCCPGQTPHHMIPNSMLQISEKAADSDKDKARNSRDASGNMHCPDYTHASAPTVCAEGRTQHECTHKDVHDASADLFTPTVMHNNHSLDQMIDHSVDAHHKAFRRSSCSKACIKKQLREYFNEKCNGNLNFRVRPVDGKGQNL